MKRVNLKMNREMNVPHADRAALSSAMEAFFEDVRLARVKHRIADVCVVASAPCLASDGDEIALRASLFLGDQARHLMLIAHVFGELQSEYAEGLAKAVAHGKNLRSPERGNE